MAEIATVSGNGGLELVIVPVRNMILFPGVVLPLLLGRERSVVSVRAAVAEERQIGLLLQHDEREELPGPDDLYGVGTVGDIMRYWTAPDGRHQAICQGVTRFEILEYVAEDPVLIARVRRIPEKETASRAIEARFLALKQRAQEVLAMAPGTPEDLEQAVEGIDSPAMLADLVATFLDVPASEKQELLETFDLRRRLDKLLEALGEAAAVLELSMKIRQDTKETLDKAQREYYLREQLRQIQNELGEGDDGGSDLEELKERARALELNEDAQRELRRELRRLERLPEQAAEHSMLRTWVEVFTELPWSERSDDAIDVAFVNRQGSNKRGLPVLEYLLFADGMEAQGRASDAAILAAMQSANRQAYASAVAADVVAKANDSQFGLVGYVWTEGLERGIRVSAKVELGPHDLLEGRGELGDARELGHRRAALERMQRATQRLRQAHAGPAVAHVVHDSSRSDPRLAINWGPPSARHVRRCDLRKLNTRCSFHHTSFRLPGRRVTFSARPSSTRSTSASVAPAPIALTSAK